LKRKNSEKMMKKLQAAMEYLMTYGWAILIIALALGVLYSLGILNPGRLKPVMCMLPAPFSCQIQTFSSSTGKLTISLAQGSGSSYTINGIACVDNSLLGTTGIPASNYWTWAKDLTFTPNIATSSYSLASGSMVTVSGIQCYLSNGGAATGLPMGSAFGGTLVINYALPSGTPAYTSGAINAQVNTP
jgi:hypothetical protein